MHEFVAMRMGTFLETLALSSTKKRSKNIVNINKTLYLLSDDLLLSMFTKEKILKSCKYFFWTMVSCTLRFMPNKHTVQNMSVKLSSYHAEYRRIKNYNCYSKTLCMVYSANAAYCYTKFRATGCWEGNYARPRLIILPLFSIPMFAIQHILMS